MENTLSGNLVVQYSPLNDMSATTLLPGRAKLRAPMPIMVCPIPRFFLRIARRGSAQIGAGLNS